MRLCALHQQVLRLLQRAIYRRALARTAQAETLLHVVEHRARGTHRHIDRERAEIADDAIAVEGGSGRDQHGGLPVCVVARPRYRHPGASLRVWDTPG
jgi:hypothetical protein